MRLLLGGRHEHVIGDSLLLLDSGLGTRGQLVCCRVRLGVKAIIRGAIIDDLTLVIRRAPQVVIRAILIIYPYIVGVVDWFLDDSVLVLMRHH